MTPKRQKILFFITKSTQGGAQRYVYDLACGLPQEKYEVSAIVGGEGPLIDMLRNAGFKVHTLKSLRRDVSLLNDIRTCFALFRILRKEKPDVFHINSSKAGVLGAIVGRIARTPKIIFTAHGWAFNEDRSALQKKILKFFHWLTIFCAHKTIVVSNGTRIQMDWPLIQEKMIVVHLGRTISDMRNKDDARGALEMKVLNTSTRLIDYHDDFWIGTIAELHPIKRLNRAIDAVSALIKTIPSLRFIIIHDGQLRAQLEQQVRDLGLEEHIFFTGTIDDAARFLPAFDLFVLPSKSEAFAYVLIEAGQARLPVVATRVGGIPDIINDMENGLLVLPDDTPALTTAIRTLITDDALRTRLANAHYEKSKLFTVEKMVNDTQRVYNMTS